MSRVAWSERAFTEQRADIAMLVDADNVCYTAHTRTADSRFDFQPDASDRCAKRAALR